MYNQTISTDNFHYCTKSKIPEWLMAELPTDLVNIFEDKISKPKTKGRSTAIEQDNVNDLVYYMAKGAIPKKRGHFYGKDMFNEYVKKACKYPCEYANDMKSYKCCVFFDCYRGHMTRKFYQFLNPFKKVYSDAPVWAKYYYIVVTDIKELNTINNQVLYKFIMDSPYAYNLIDITLNKVNECQNKTSFLKFTKTNKEKDTAFYKSLSNDQKGKISRNVGLKILNLNINDCLAEDCNFESIFLVKGEIGMANFVIENNKIEDFKHYIDENRNLYANMKRSKIVRPKYRELYLYAYSKTDASKLNDDRELYSYVHDHVSLLISNQCTNELQFLTSKKYLIEVDQAKLVLKTLNKQIIRLLRSDILETALDDLLVNDDEKIDQILELGYQPSVNGVSLTYINSYLPSRCKTFKIFDFLPISAKLDRCKSNIACFHPELIEEFIEKFNDRFETNTKESWHLEYCHDLDNYKKACRILNIDEHLFMKRLFRKAWNNLISDDESRDIILYVFKNCDEIDCSVQKYWKYVIKNDDLKLAAELVRHGSDPKVITNWKKKMSYEMYKIVIDNS